MDALTNLNTHEQKNNEELITKASSFWKFLDDLATNDPSAYDEFMYKTKKSQVEAIMNNKNKNNKNKTDKNTDLIKQFDENIEIAKNSLNGTLNGEKRPNKYFFTPIPFMVIKTKISSTKTIVETLLNVNDYRNVMKKGQKLYINFLESPYCIPLQLKSNINNKITNKTPISDILIPIQVSHLINEEQHDIYWRSDIIYHNSVYKRFNNNNNMSQLFKKWIIEYAFRQIESQNSLKLIRDYKIIKKKKFIGKTPPKPQFIQQKNVIQNKSKLEENRNTKLKIENKSEENSITKLTMENDEKKKENEINNLFSIGNNIRNNKNKYNNNNNNDDKKDKYIDNIMENKSYLIPKYTLNVDTEKKNIIKIIVHMEKENDIKDIELSVNESRLLLKSLYYKLDLIFPMSVNDGNVKAKFDKKKHCLKLKFPIKL